MASLLDQYEKANAARTGASAAPSKASADGTTSVSTETPIFSKQRVDFQIPSGKSIYRMAICDRLIILAMKDGTVFRIDLKNSPDQMDSLDVRSSSPNDTVEDIFLDPFGKHLLIAMRSGECLYLGRNAKKARILSKLKNQFLSAVGWLPIGNDKSGPALIGTGQGLVFETEFNPNAAESSVTFLSGSLELYWKQVCNLAQPDPVNVRGIHINRVQQLPNHAIVLIATPTRLFQFKGELGNLSENNVFQEIFQLDPEKPMTNFIELPGNPRSCCMSAFPVFSHDRETISSFAWLTEPGVYHSELTNVLSNESSVLIKPQLFPLSRDKSFRATSVVTTEFHILLQSATVVKAVSKLANAVVHEEMFPDKYGKLLGILRDPISNTVWAYSETAVYRYRIVDESRYVWKLYLERGEFDFALKYSIHLPNVNNYVKILKADNLFELGDYEKSAELYAACDAPFEEISLKFSRSRQEKALKTLLVKKAEKLKSTKDRPQLFMIASWLMEIYLNALGQMRSSGKEEASYNDLLVEFRSFMANPTFADIFKSSPAVFYSLILSHAAHEDYVALASQLGDTRRVVEYHIERGNFMEALRILMLQGSSELIYEFSGGLLKNAPARTVDVWIAKGRNLNPHRLLPMLQKWTGDESETEAKEILRYLEYCARHLESTDPAVHNCLINLFCQTGKEEDLLRYLEFVDEESKRKSVELYDPKVSLRICLESRFRRASVHLLCVLGLYVEAVELALEYDTDRAKEIASNSSLEEDLRRRLWLMIARNVIQQNTSISRATELLHESGNLIKIEDILPFFPDFVTIDDFKDAICASLEEYNQHIKELKEEVEEATKDADGLRAEMHEYKKRCMFINADDICCVCKQTLLSQQVFVFPCQHNMHFSCLLSLVKRLGGQNLSVVDELKRQLESMADHEDSVSLASSGSGMGTAMSRREMVKQELENLVADECPYCGRLMINAIDAPFVSVEDIEIGSSGW